MASVERGEDPTISVHVFVIRDDDASPKPSHAPLVQPLPDLVDWCTKNDDRTVTRFRLFDCTTHGVLPLSRADVLQVEEITQRHLIAGTLKDAVRDIVCEDNRGAIAISTPLRAPVKTCVLVNTQSSAFKLGYDRVSIESTTDTTFALFECFAFRDDNLVLLLPVGVEELRKIHANVAMRDQMVKPPLAVGKRRASLATLLASRGRTTMTELQNGGELQCVVCLDGPVEVYPRCCSANVAGLCGPCAQKLRYTCVVCDRYDTQDKKCGGCRQTVDCEQFGYPCQLCARGMLCSRCFDHMKLCADCSRH